MSGPSEAHIVHRTFRHRGPDWGVCAFGGPGRYCPAVQNTFGFTSYDHNTTIL